MPKEPMSSKAMSHNDMYKPKGMNLKDNTVSAKSFCCDKGVSFYPKNDMV